MLVVAGVVHRWQCSSSCCPFQCILPMSGSRVYISFWTLKTYTMWNFILIKRNMKSMFVSVVIYIYDGDYKKVHKPESTRFINILSSTLIKHVICIVFTIRRKMKVNSGFKCLVLQSFQSELPWASCPNRYYGNGSYTAEPECVVSSMFTGQYLV